jgi:hypothetical protein
VGTFTGTILVRGVRSSGFDVITSVGEELDDSVTATKFAAKIEAHVTVGNGHGETMKCEPRIQKINGWSFGNETLAEQHTTMMVDYKAVACLAMETTKTFDAGAIGG